MLNRLIRFFLENKIIVFLMILLFVGWGIIVAPFDWDLPWFPRNPVPVDAIPDIGENQQIVFTEWMGRSPQDVEDQITYPLTVSLLGIPGVKTVRSSSMLGFSIIYIIFKDNVDFYWSRSRVLEKLSSLPSETLPSGVKPALGPDSTALGQIFWYTLEGHDKGGNPTGGWDLHELRTIQDWYVKYALLSVDGVSEVASIGGFVKEYQIDVDPDAMKGYNISLKEVVSAVKMSNLDVGARTIEINNVEYIIRGIGFIKTLEDIEDAVIKVNDNVPVYVRNIAKVSLGPAMRRGVLDKEGAEAVGGVVVVRYGRNPLAVIDKIKEKIKEISPGLPNKTLANGTLSQVKIVPFYDRSGLIHETLGTLNTALILEIMVTIIVILIMVMHFRSSLLISGLLPLTVLFCFIVMKLFHVDANIVALSGIAIAIGTIVDMGIVICENILKHLDKAGQDENRLEVVFRATKEVGSAVLTAVATTVVSFLPVFFMEAAEGKLFRPLAFTKTFMLIGSIIVALFIIPSIAHLVFTLKFKKNILFENIPNKFKKMFRISGNMLIVLLVIILLSSYWLPMGHEKGQIINFLFVLLMIGGFLFIFKIFQKVYEPLLRWFLDHKLIFISIPGLLIFWGAMVWFGFNGFFGWLPDIVQKTRYVAALDRIFPGLGKEFMPALDEGSFLYMPTTMPHVSIGEAHNILRQQNTAISNIPEIESVVGKIGRAQTPLDPAPISMMETIINYYPEYIVDKNGKPVRFKFNHNKEDFFRNKDGTSLLAPDNKPYKVNGKFERNDKNELIPDPKGMPFRLWRRALVPDLNPDRKAWEGVNSPDDIWELIKDAAQIPGVTSAPKLQPIMTRIVMLQTGMRAPIGIKIKGTDLKSIEKTGLELESILKEMPFIEPSSVFADRIIGKPYLEIEIDRQAIAHYGIMLKDVQDVIEIAVGGKRITTTVEGRERYPVRIRYFRELRDNIESLGRILVAASNGAQIPLNQIAKINYVNGPQVIKSEDTFLIGYVIFDKKPGYAEVDVVEKAKAYIEEKIEQDIFKLPSGTSLSFTGNYENQVRAQEKLMVIVPLALLVIFLLLYFQFHSVFTTLLVFSGILVAWSGGFIMLWLYAQPWFLDFSIFSLRELFLVHPINLSVAVWVGFLALFGIATDDGVIMATYLDQHFTSEKVKSIKEIREATIKGACRRVRPAVMTSATTILALIPVITSTGRGADIMIPMAIPSFGGMCIAMATLFVVPVLYCSIKEFRLK